MATARPHPLLKGCWCSWISVQARLLHPAPEQSCHALVLWCQLDAPAVHHIVVLGEGLLWAECRSGRFGSSRNCSLLFVAAFAPVVSRLAGISTVTLTLLVTALVLSRNVNLEALQIGCNSVSPGLTNRVSWLSFCSVRPSGQGPVCPWSRSTWCAIVLRVSGRLDKSFLPACIIWWACRCWAFEFTGMTDTVL